MGAAHRAIHFQTTRAAAPWSYSLPQPGTAGGGALGSPPSIMGEPWVLPLKHRSSPACSSSWRRVLVALQGCAPTSLLGFLPSPTPSQPLSPTSPGLPEPSFQNTHMAMPSLSKPCRDSPLSSAPLFGLALPLQHHAGSFPSGTLSTVLLSPLELPYAPTPLHAPFSVPGCSLLSHPGDKLPHPSSMSSASPGGKHCLP